SEAQMATGNVTALLERYRHGDRAAESELFQRIVGELRRLAAHYLSRERRDHILQPTALVNEAYLRLVGQREKEWANRSHFVAVAASVMRQVLIDCARQAKAEKRDFGVATELDDSIPAVTAHPDMLIDLDAALTRLAACDERQARVVELRYFAGLSIEETAQ